VGGAQQGVARAWRSGLHASAVYATACRGPLPGRSCDG
jgi:hypothetical protein